MQVCVDVTLSPFGICTVSGRDAGIIVPKLVVKRRRVGTNEDSYPKSGIKRDAMSAIKRGHLLFYDAR